MGASRQARHREQQARRDDGGEGSGQATPASTGETGAAAASDSGRRPGLVDATRYDLDRLEGAIRQMLAQHQQLAEENESLRRRLQGREADVDRLEGELAASRERREQALARVDALIAELDRLDGLLDTSMAAWRARSDGAASEADGASGSPG